MLKRLAIFGLLLATANTSKKNDSSKLTQGNGENNCPPSVSFTNNEASYPNTETAKTEPPHWYTVPEWWLCILGIPTLYYLVRQAEATRVAANAALLGAQAVIDSERAWLEVTMGTDVLSTEGIVPGEKMVAMLPTVINQGRTPARLRKMYLRHHLCKKGTQLPEHPVYSLDVGDSSYFEGEMLMVPKAERSPLSVDMDATDIDLIHAEDGGFTLYLYGYVEYEISAPAGQRDRSTCFIFVYDVASKYSPIPEGFHMPTGYPAYNRAT